VSNWNAWLAGYLDGEGCIRIDSSSDGPRLSVASTVRSVLEEIVSQEGGNIIDVKRHRGFNPRRKRQWEWRFYSPDGIQDLLERTRPYMRIKQTEAWLMLEYLAQRTMVPRDQRRHAVSEEERSLRHGFRLALQGAKA
jgi:hypothetical protein